VFRKRNELHPPTVVCGGILLLQPAVDSIHFRLSLWKRHTRFQTCIPEHGVFLTVQLAAVENEGDIEVQLAVEDPEDQEIGRQNADYSMGFALNHDLLPNEIRITAEAALPETVA